MAADGWDFEFNLWNFLNSVNKQLTFLRANPLATKTLPLKNLTNVLNNVSSVLP